MPEYRNPDDITARELTKWLDRELAGTDWEPKRGELQHLIHQIHVLAQHLAAGRSWHSDDVAV